MIIIKVHVKGPQLMPRQAFSIVGNCEYRKDVPWPAFFILSGSYFWKFLYNSEQSIEDFRKAIDQKDSSIKEFYNLFIDPHIQINREDLKKLRNKEIMLIDTAQEIMVMEDYEKKRPTYILNRGIYDARGQLVDSEVPESIFKMPSDCLLYTSDAADE